MTQPETEFPHRPADPASNDPYVVGPTTLATGAGAGPLVGWTFAAKDLYDVAGTRRGDGNPDRLVDAPVATRHAPPVQALLDAGATLVGKTVTDELAFSLSGTNVHYGTPPNPAVPGAVPGGSSSGSVSLVASGEVDLALGTDTGGSTRVPASYCGIYGLRTTHGRISTEGVMLLAPSFCSLGLFAPDIERLTAGWIAVRDGASTVADRVPARPPAALVVAPALFALADRDAGFALRAGAESLASAAGLPLIEDDVVGTDELDELRSAFRAIQMYEAWQVHGRWITAHPGSLGGGIAARFALAAQVTNEEVDDARARRQAFTVRFARALSGGRYLLQPAASGPAPSIALDGPAKDALRTQTITLCCVAGLAGAPVVAAPAARVAGGPVGLAIVGLAGDDDEVVDLAGKVTPVR